eukprot:719339-Pleurochrysis_carterae.AAC.1
MHAHTRTLTSIGTNEYEYSAHTRTRLRTSSRRRAHRQIYLRPPSGRIQTISTSFGAPVGRACPQARRSESSSQYAVALVLVAVPTIKYPCRSMIT